mmetsp:Transcript_61107/g.101643  ORF Transcript_61107/g.101643 Transcript_61107/m.101643 type:complete len:186 (+) Transcript_61107:3426-3983(+)
MYTQSLLGLLSPLVSPPPSPLPSPSPSPLPSLLPSPVPSPVPSSRLSLASLPSPLFPRLSPLASIPSHLSPRLSSPLASPLAPLLAPLLASPLAPRLASPLLASPGTYSRITSCISSRNFPVLCLNPPHSLGSVSSGFDYRGSHGCFARDSYTTCAHGVVMIPLTPWYLAAFLRIAASLLCSGRS